MRQPREGQGLAWSLNGAVGGGQVGLLVPAGSLGAPCLKEELSPARGIGK